MSKCQCVNCGGTRKAVNHKQAHESEQGDTTDIEQLCREALEDDKRATPGPWRQGNVETYHVFCPYADALAPELGRVLLRMNTHFEHEADTAFIAAARTREPLLAEALLAEREETERLRVEVRRLKALSELRGNEVAKWANESGVAKGQRDELRARLAARTAARDELAIVATMALDHMDPHVEAKAARIAELRAVGKEPL